MKYTISEFAEEIRALYPGDYDDLTDGKLVELWLKKNPKDIDKVDLSRKETIDTSDYFSFKGIIAACFFGYVAYYFYSLAVIISNVNDFINRDDFFSKFLLHGFNNLSEGKFEDYLSFFHFWLWLLFVSFSIKTLISLRHAFYTPVNNLVIVGTVGILCDTLPIFLFSLKYNTFEDSMPMLLMYVPTIIGLLFLYNEDDFR
jgi:hypothetical protein